jgi:hypothetical protein
MDDYNEISEREYLKSKIPLAPYPIGVVKKAEILINRKSGVTLAKILPWLHTLEKSQSYIFAPSDPEEFFEQLNVAYEKWKRLNIKAH